MMLQHHETAQLREPTNRWQQRERTLNMWVPYITLGIASLLSLIQPDQAWFDRTQTGVFVILAALWVFGMHTQVAQADAPPQRRMRVYFGGLLLISTLLMLHQPIFFVFCVTGFFHAALLRPWPLMIVGVALTSILLNTVNTGFPWQALEGWVFFGAIIIVQTPAIAFGIYMSERIIELSEQRRQALIQLEATINENAGLQERLLAQAHETGILDERQRMAREIHDTLAQGLAGIVTQLEAAERATQHPALLHRHLNEARTLARASLGEARRSVQALQPEPLEAFDLPVALQQLAYTWAGSYQIELQFATTGTPQQLLPEIEAALFRVAQEALTNVAKHANARRVGVTLSYMDDLVVLDVRDDGLGFVSPLPPSVPLVNRAAGFGLCGMTQRVQRVAGELAIESAPGQGTAISASVPALGAQLESVTNETTNPPLTG